MGKKTHTYLAMLIHIILGPVVITNIVTLSVLFLLRFFLWLMGRLGERKYLLLPSDRDWKIIETVVHAILTVETLMMLGNNVLMGMRTLTYLLGLPFFLSAMSILKVQLTILAFQLFMSYFFERLNKSVVEQLALRRKEKKEREQRKKAAKKAREERLAAQKQEQDELKKAIERSLQDQGQEKDEEKVNEEGQKQEKDGEDSQEQDKVYEKKASEESSEGQQQPERNNEKKASEESSESQDEDDEQAYEEGRITDHDDDWRREDCKWRFPQPDMDHRIKLVQDDGGLSLRLMTENLEMWEEMCRKREELEHAARVAEYNEAAREETEADRNLGEEDNDYKEVKEINHPDQQNEATEETYLGARMKFSKEKGFYLCDEAEGGINPVSHDNLEIEEEPVTHQSPTNQLKITDEETQKEHQLQSSSYGSREENKTPNGDNDISHTGQYDRAAEEREAADQNLTNRLIETAREGQDKPFLGFGSSQEEEGLDNDDAKVSNKYDREAEDEAIAAWNKTPEVTNTAEEDLERKYLKWISVSASNYTNKDSTVWNTCNQYDKAAAKTTGWSLTNKLMESIEESYDKFFEKFSMTPQELEEASNKAAEDLRLANLCQKSADEKAVEAESLKSGETKEAEAEAEEEEEEEEWTVLGFEDYVILK